jgi:hypothetical protein
LETSGSAFACTGGGQDDSDDFEDLLFGVVVRAGDNQRFATPTGGILQQMTEQLGNHRMGLATADTADSDGYLGGAIVELLLFGAKDLIVEGGGFLRGLHVALRGEMPFLRYPCLDDVHVGLMFLDTDTTKAELLCCNHGRTTAREWVEYGAHHVGAITVEDLMLQESSVNSRG